MAKYFQVDVPLPAGAVPIGSQAQALYDATVASPVSSMTPFIVSQVMRGVPRVPANHYTQRPSQRNEQYWMVRANFAQAPDRWVDFYFEDEAEARVFAKKGVNTIPELWSGLDPLNAMFTSLGAATEKRPGEINRYTGRPESKEFWHALLWCEQYGRYADVWSPNQADVAQYTPGTAMTLPALLLPQFTFRKVVQRLTRPPSQPPSIGNLQLPPEFIGPLLNFEMPVVFYPSALYAAEYYFSGGKVDQDGYSDTGYQPAGVRNAGYNFGEGIYDAGGGVWLPLQLTPFAGVPPVQTDGLTGLGTVGYTGMVVARKRVNGQYQWFIAYLIL